MATQDVETPYTHKEYPKWMYHEGQGDDAREPVLVTHPSEAELLGVGWGHSPAGPFAEAPEPEVEPDPVPEPAPAPSKRKAKRAAKKTKR
jgi:hypothetical protein